MKTWNFTFADEYNDWGWNSVQARGVKSAVKKAEKWVAKMGKGKWTLNVNSVNCSTATEKMLLSNFY